MLPENFFFLSSLQNIIKEQMLCLVKGYTYTSPLVNVSFEEFEKRSRKGQKVGSKVDKQTLARTHTHVHVCFTRFGPVGQDWVEVPDTNMEKGMHRHSCRRHPITDKSATYLDVLADGFPVPWTSEGKGLGHVSIDWRDVTSGLGFISIAPLRRLKLDYVVC